MRQQMRISITLAIFCALSFAIAAAQDTLRAGSPLLKGAMPALGTNSVESYKLEKDVRTPIKKTKKIVQTVLRGSSEQPEYWSFAE